MREAVSSWQLRVSKLANNRVSTRAESSGDSCSQAWRTGGCVSPGELQDNASAASRSACVNRRCAQCRKRASLATDARLVPPGRLSCPHLRENPEDPGPKQDRGPIEGDA